MGIIIDYNTTIGAIVDSNHRLYVQAIGNSEAYEINKKGDSYILNFNVIPTESSLITPNNPSIENPSAFIPNNPFLFIRNTSEEVDLIITKLSVYVTADTLIIIRINPIGDPNSNSYYEETPVNLNSGSGESAVGDFFVGANITGIGLGPGSIPILDGEGYIIKNWRINDNDGITDLDFNSNIILQDTGATTLETDDIGAQLEMSVEFHYIDRD